MRLSDYNYSRRVTTLSSRRWIFSNMSSNIRKASKDTHPKNIRLSSSRYTINSRCMNIDPEIAKRYVILKNRSIKLPITPLGGRERYDKKIYNLYI